MLPSHHAKLLRRAHWIVVVGRPHVAVVVVEHSSVKMWIVRHRMQHWMRVDCFSVDKVRKGRDWMTTTILMTSAWNGIVVAAR